MKSLLRQGSQRWPPAQEVMKLNRRPYQGEDKRTKWEYQCNHCKGWFKQKEVNRDHIEATGGWSDDFDKWPEDLGRIAEAMFCNVDGFQILCLDCHRILTNKENEERRSKKK